MWKQYPIAKTLLGLAVVVVLVVSASSERTSADGSASEECEYDSQQCPACMHDTPQATTVAEQTPSRFLPSLGVQSAVPTQSATAGLRTSVPAAPAVPAAVPATAGQPATATQQVANVPQLPSFNPQHAAGSAFVQAPALQLPPSLPPSVTRRARTTSAGPRSVPAFTNAPNVSTQPNASTGGLPSGTWVNETIMGDVTMTIQGNKLSIQFEGKGEFAPFQPTLRGEYSVASDGTIFGLIHCADFGSAVGNAEEFSEGFFLLSGLSDIPFSIRTYAQPDVLAIKQVTLGVPTQVMIASEGEFSEVLVYAQSILAGQYQPTR